MGLRIFFSFILCINAVFTIYLSVSYANMERAKNEYDKTFIILCIASAIWGLGFGLMFLQDSVTGAYFCRSFAIFGTFLFMIMVQKLICSIAEINQKIKRILMSVSYLGMPLYFLSIQPSQTSYSMSKLGMAYTFTPGIINVLYNVYFVLVSLDIVGLTVHMIKRGSLKRIQTFGKRFLLVEVFVIGGTVFDMFLPALGMHALPGSNITQFWGLLVLWFAIKDINQSQITISNMSEYIYYSLDKPMIVFDAKKQVKIMNEAAGQFLNIDPEKAKENKDKASNFFSVSDNTFFFKGNSTVREANCHVNGAPCQLAISKIDDKYEDTIGYIVIINDMTELNQAMQKLEKAKKEADAANKSKSMFLANMSHEIRTPMNAIIGFANLALIDNLGEQANEYFADIKSSAESLLAIINDVLSISKIELGKSELVIDDYKPAKVFHEVSLIIGMQAKNKKLAYETVIDEDVPNALRGDKDKIREILINLLNNSVKYTEKGKVTLKVSVKSKEAGKAVMRYQIIDTGIGIKESELGKIFDKFQRVDLKVNSKTEGTGLGLSITKGLIEMMGGIIKVESVYGEGSTFTVEIPQKIVDESPIQLIKGGEEEEFKHEVHFKDVKFLAVDDNKINLKVISKVMEQYGIENDLADSGAEAIRLCKENHYDVVLMDHMMPEIDGVEAMKRIRDLHNGYEKNGSCKIVVLTANVIEGVKEQLLKVGFDDFLGKPIDLGQFEKCIRKILPEDKYYFADIVTDSASEGNKNNRLEKIEELGKEKGLMEDNKYIVIDTAKGLENFGGDEDDYREIVEMTADACEDDLAELMGYYDRKDIENFVIKVHGMKSQSYYVGGTNIGDFAKSLEFAGKESRIDYIDENVTEFKEAYEAFASALKEYLG